MDGDEDDEFHQQRIAELQAKIADVEAQIVVNYSATFVMPQFSLNLTEVLNNDEAHQQCQQWQVVGDQFQDALRMLSLNLPVADSGNDQDFVEGTDV